MTKLNLSADEVLTTTRAVRKRLDFDRPIDDAVIRECLDVALQAPTGSNSQSWRFVVLTDRDKIAGISELYRKGFEAYIEMKQSAPNIATQSAQREAQQIRVTASATYLAENMHRSPAMLIPVLPMKVEGFPNFAASSTYGGIIPAAWSFCLAARERSIGTAWTTIHLMFEEEAADIIGMPFAETSQIAAIPMAYTKGTDFKLATREPLDTVAFWNGWE